MLRIATVINFLADFTTNAYDPPMIAETEITSEDTEDTEWEFAPPPDVSNLITEDDTPVDNQFSEKQMRLLTESLHASWNPGFPFVAMANVGVYVALNRAAIVPDVLVTTHVEPLQEIMSKDHRAYFSWQYDGKVPEVVIEIVSNKKGGELDSKKRNYEHMGFRPGSLPHSGIADSLCFRSTPRAARVSQASVQCFLGRHRPRFDDLGG
jgi:Uma2 family endonuclease